MVFYQTCKLICKHSAILLKSLKIQYKPSHIRINDGKTPKDPASLSPEVTTNKQYSHDVAKNSTDIVK